jgi:hypothetical protein
MYLRAGDVVEVKSKEEILATLDRDGKLDGLPFMPEMLEHCGQRFTVGKVAHKTCDTIHSTGARRMLSAVHLQGLRCSGAAHGSCQAACNLFWKTAWLRRSSERPTARTAATRPSLCDEQRLREAACHEENGEAVFSCQATELSNATTPLPWWAPSQYVRDVVSGNNSIWLVLRTLVLAGLRTLIRTGVGFRALIRINDTLARLTGGRTYVEPVGPFPKGAPTPDSSETFVEGDWVRIRRYEEILSTLNSQGLNRGLTFDPEMMPYCGGTYRVRAIVERIIDEKTGRMLKMKRTCVMLDGVVCKSEFIRKRLLCPRAIFPYWRPLWLERVPEEQKKSSH